MIARGFLDNKINFIVNRDNFLNHHSHIYMERRDFQVIKSYEVTLDYTTKNILGTIGEFFEREVLINTNKIKIGKLPAISMLNADIKYIETSKVVFDVDFVDSCGMASHIISSDIIRTAIFEFFERQCFIFNYLSQGLAEKIDIANCDQLVRYDMYIKNFTDDISYFNISLNNSLYVIIALAFGDEKKAIGLGTDTCCIGAVLKAQKEILQNFAVECSKYKYTDIGFQYKCSGDIDLYHANFSTLSPLIVKEKYEYLSESPIRKIDSMERGNFQLNRFLYEINEVYGMDPHIVFLRTKRLVNHLKVIKIVDFNWFPNMRPGIYNEYIYNYVEEKTNKVLNREVDIIPFP